MAVKSFSKSKEGKLKLTPNFTVAEFACKDGSDMILIDTMLVYYLQKIREHFGKVVRINSAYRTSTYNAQVGGASESQHMQGAAADIVIDEVTPEQVAQYADQLGMGGVGIYKTFTHVDVRSIKARWVGYYG